MSLTIGIDKVAHILGEGTSRKQLFKASITKSAEYYQQGQIRVDAGASDLEIVPDCNFCILVCSDPFEVRTAVNTEYMLTQAFAYDGYTDTIEVNNPNSTAIVIDVFYGGSVDIESITGAPALTGAAPLTVNFTSSLVGTAQTYLWTFGDGNTSVEAAPQHEYAAPGTYTVSLKVVAADGSVDRLELVDYITAT